MTNLNKINDVEKQNDESILIVDTTTDQCTCGGTAWVILHDTGTKIQCNGYLKGQDSDEGPLLPVVTAVTCVVIDGQEPFLMLVNQACYHEHVEQNESLLHPYQAMDHGVRFCLTPKESLDSDGVPGRQKIVVSDKEIPLNYDGRKMFLSIRKPLPDELDSLEIMEMISPDTYIPEEDRNDDSLIRRDSKRKYKEYPGGLSLQEWRKRLAMAPEDIIRKTFDATTQLALSVEVNNRLVPRQHHKSRFPFLREKRIRDEFQTDTFFFVDTYK